jgi:hypothetical protein
LIAIPASLLFLGFYADLTVFTFPHLLQGSNHYRTDRFNKRGLEEKKMKNYSPWVLALIIAGGAAGIVGTTTRTTTSVRNDSAAEDSATPQQNNSAAFRGGTYLGNLAAKRGDVPHGAVARWANDADRALFVTAYNQYSQTLNRIVSADQGDLAAFRDGLYLGKLDTELGNAPHVAVARWSKISNRLSFAQGYRQAYNNGMSACSQQDKNIHQALLVR